MCGTTFKKTFYCRNKPCDAKEAHTLWETYGGLKSHSCIHSSVISLEVRHSVWGRDNAGANPALPTTLCRYGVVETTLACHVRVRGAIPRSGATFRQFGHTRRSYKSVILTKILVPTILCVDRIAANSVGLHPIYRGFESCSAHHFIA